MGKVPLTFVSPFPCNTRTLKGDEDGVVYDIVREQAAGGEKAWPTGDERVKRTQMILMMAAMRR